MCYPAYAGAQADPPSLKKLWRDRRKSGAYTGVCEHFWEVSNTVIGRLSAKDLWRIKCVFEIASSVVSHK
jgi:hypothetical protein